MWNETYEGLKTVNILVEASEMTIQWILTALIEAAVMWCHAFACL